MKLNEDHTSTAIFIRITSCANESSAGLVPYGPGAPEVPEAPGLVFKETLHLSV